MNCSGNKRIQSCSQLKLLCDTTHEGVVGFAQYNALIVLLHPTRLCQFVDGPALALGQILELGIGRPGAGNDRSASALLERLGGG